MGDVSVWSGLIGNGIVIHKVIAKNDQNTNRLLNQVEIRKIYDAVQAAVRLVSSNKNDEYSTKKLDFNLLKLLWEEIEEEIEKENHIKGGKQKLDTRVYTTNGA